MYASITPILYKQVVDNNHGPALESIMQVLAMISSKEVVLVGFSGRPGGETLNMSRYDSSAVATILGQAGTRKGWLYAVYGEYNSSADVWRLDTDSELEGMISVERQSTRNPTDFDHAIELEKAALRSCELLLCDGSFFDYSVWGIDRESRWIGCEGLIYLKEIKRRASRSPKRKDAMCQLFEQRAVVSEIQETFRTPIVVLDNETELLGFMANMARRIHARLGVQVLL